MSDILMVVFFAKSIDSNILYLLISQIFSGFAVIIVIFIPALGMVHKQGNTF